MFRMMMKSKLHCARVTEANLNYVGSITIAKDLMGTADIWPNEKVDIVNKNNGARFSTYVIEGEPGSGMICLNGAAARLVQPGDEVIIISYGLMDEAKASSYQPTVVILGDNNQVLAVEGKELHGEIR